MRRSGLALASSWGLLLLSFCQPLTGQNADGVCLNPLPLYEYQGSLPGGPLAGEKGEEAGSPLFVSPSGELCRTFQPHQINDVAEQSVVRRAPEPGKAFLLSAVLPGAGQWYQGKDRWPAYLVVEAWAWIQFLDWRREGHDVQTQYKDLAWYVARRVSTGPRTEADWEYYEALTRYKSSGAYDTDPHTAGIQPEEDPGTFNGTVWALAQEIYIPEDPENQPEPGSEPYEKAFSYYLSRAYASNFAWEWGVGTLHQEEYTTLIRKSDEALRNSTEMVGVIIANHLLSAVDALVSGRLGIAGEVEPAVEFLSVPGPFNNRGVALQVRIPNPLAYVH